MIIIPAILTNDPIELDHWLKKIRDGGKFERVQVDFIDGEYADNLTIKPTECDLIPYLPLKFDAHMMVRDDRVLFWGMEAEKMGFERVFYQVESLEKNETRPYIAVDLETELEGIPEYLWEEAKGVLILGVRAGFAGQKMATEAWERIEWIGQLRRQRNYEFSMGVDGGVEQEHLEELANLDVDEAVVGAKRVWEWKLS